MKVEVKKSMLKKRGYTMYIAGGYCETFNEESLERLLGTANWYTTGIYGWNCDIWDFGAFGISCGYRPFGIDIKHELIEKCSKIENLDGEKFREIVWEIVRNK